MPHNPRCTPYSVLLLYPERRTDSRMETWFGHVDATSPAQAVALARYALCAAEPLEPGDEPSDPNDYVVLLVLAGAHQNLHRWAASPPL